MTRTDSQHPPAPWGRHPLREGDSLTVELGPLTLRARRREGEVWLAHVPGDWTRAARRRAGDPSPDGGEEEWTRWPVPGETSGLNLAPLFPPRPLIAEPELSFRLLSRSRARVFIGVPLWVRVSTLGDAGRTLCEVPSVTLSDTWWGDPTEGELCYWLATTARREVPPGTFDPNVAVCPLELANRSDDELPVERVALRVAHLTLFGDDGRLWADETRVRYRGVEEGSDVEVSGKRPQEAPESVRVAEPRDPPPRRGLHTRTFARLRELSRLGEA